MFSHRGTALANDRKFWSSNYKRFMRRWKRSWKNTARGVRLLNSLDWCSKESLIIDSLLPALHRQWFPAVWPLCTSLHLATHLTGSVLPLSWIVMHDMPGHCKTKQELEWSPCSLPAWVFGKVSIPLPASLSICLLSCHPTCQPSLIFSLDGRFPSILWLLLCLVMPNMLGYSKMKYSEWKPEPCFHAIFNAKHQYICLPINFVSSVFALWMFYICYPMAHLQHGLGHLKVRNKIMFCKLYRRLEETFCKCHRSASLLLCSHGETESCGKSQKRRQTKYSRTSVSWPPRDWRALEVLL